MAIDVEVRIKAHFAEPALLHIDMMQGVAVGDVDSDGGGTDDRAVYGVEGVHGATFSADVGVVVEEGGGGGPEVRSGDVGEWVEEDAVETAD